MQSATSHPDPGQLDRGHTVNDSFLLIGGSLRDRQAWGDPIVRGNEERCRTLRVCLYASAVGWRRPEWSLEVLVRLAELRHWQAAKAIADSFPWTTCAARPGWGLVRAEIGAGRAGGVVVLAESDISRSPEEYAGQLAWFQAHSAFIVVKSAAAGGLR